MLKKNNPRIYASYMKPSMIFLGIIFSSNFVGSQSLQKAYPSAWAWQVSSANRTLYLLGEQHSFSSNSDLNIDYSLGEAAYKVSALVYKEPRQIESKTSTTLLSSMVSKEIWQKIVTESKILILELSKKTEAEKIALHSKFVTELDTADPFNVNGNLGILIDMRRKKLNPNFRFYIGLADVLEIMDNQSKEKKILYIEDTSAVDTSWRRNCYSKDKTEVILQAGIEQLTSIVPYEETDAMKTQKIFFDNDLNAMVNEFSSSLFMQTATECINHPRNLNWMPKLTKLLETKGPPVSIVVGVGHVVGDKGLLELLKASGYTDIKRIYEIKP